jgi:hypothetical protein
MDVVQVEPQLHPTIVLLGRRGCNRRHRTGGMIGCMDLLSSRILLRPADRDRSRRFYQALGLPSAGSSVIATILGSFFLGGGHLELSGAGDGTSACNLALWLQVRDLAAEHQRLQLAGVEIVRAPERDRGVCWRCGSPIRTGYHRSR